MLDEIFGVRLKQVQGYPGSNDKRMAIERGELDGDCGSWTSLPDDWLRDKKINLFVRFSRNTTADMPKDLLYAGSLISDPEMKETYALLMSGAELGRPVIGPPPARRQAGCAARGLQRHGEGRRFPRRRSEATSGNQSADRAGSRRAIGRDLQDLAGAIKRARAISGE